MLSVIIPTYNNGNELQKCLRHLENQTTDRSFEVIVVNDGSTDNTGTILEGWEKQKPSFELKVIHQENKKQGAARNRGVQDAQFDLIAFIGADILVHPDWVDTHLEFHQKNPDEKAVALGFTTWAPELANDRFRIWLESSGVQFDYHSLKDGQQTDFWHWYSSNISMKKKWFTKFQFDESFNAYGWEDIMVGYEMQKAGGTLTYLESAKAYHDDELAEADVFPKRMQSIGKSAIIFQEKHPEIKVIPTGLKKMIFQVIGWGPVTTVLGLLKKEWSWYALSKRYFLQGANE